MLRKATLDDTHSILSIVREFSDRELMLPLSLGNVYERLRDFTLLEKDNVVVGCVAVHVTWDRLVEIRSLAVSSSYQGLGYGGILLEAALSESSLLLAHEVFTLTYIPSFFQRFGFDLIERHTLPHKVWHDCIHCPKFPDCGEFALKRAI